MPTTIGPAAPGNTRCPRVALALTLSLALSRSGRTRSARLGTCYACQDPCVASASGKGWLCECVRSLGSSWASEAQGLYLGGLQFPVCDQSSTQRPWDGQQFLIAVRREDGPHALWIWPGWNEMTMKMVLVTGHTQGSPCAGRKPSPHQPFHLCTPITP